jgi:hypothetical protein
MSAVSKKPSAGTQRFVEATGLYYESYGLPRIGGEMLGYLVALGRPASPQEMAEALGISRGSVSINLRIMRTIGFVDMLASPGRAADLYSVAPRAWENAIQARATGFARLRELAEEGLSAARGTEPSAALRQMLEWAVFMEKTNAQALKRWKARKPGRD